MSGELYNVIFVEFCVIISPHFNQKAFHFSKKERKGGTFPVEARKEQGILIRKKKPYYFVCPDRENIPSKNSES